MGTMLWYRTKALMGLFQENISLQDFPKEPIPVGGTLAHAIERCPVPFAQEAGFDSKFYTQYEEEKRETMMIDQFIPSTGIKDAVKAFVDKHLPWRKKYVKTENVGVKRSFTFWLLKKAFGDNIRIYY